MARGKYSPTVTVAYHVDQCWFSRLGGIESWVGVDHDGYDEYGYEGSLGGHGKDRAGYTYEDYRAAAIYDENGVEINPLFDDVMARTKYDGTRPVVS